MKKFIAVFMTVCLILVMSATVAFANYEAADNSTTKASNNESSDNNSELGSRIGDALQLLDGFGISSLIGEDTMDTLNGILGGLTNDETTTENVPATRPVEVTEEADKPETTTLDEKAIEESKKAEEEKKTTATTAQAVQNYYYYYVTPTTDAPATVAETTTVTYDYIPPETIYTDLLTTATYVGQEDAVDTSDGFSIKTVIGIIILIGSGAAVVFLCIRRRNSY